MKNTRKMMAFLIGITLLTISPAYADHDRAVTTEQMPRQAQEFIARYFPGIVSMPIETKVQELYPGAAVIKIERDKQEVEVKLNNGMELTFDRSHNLIGIDD